MSAAAKDPNEVVAYISLGSNIGDRAYYLTEAISRLGAHPQIQVAHVSSIYETEPVGYTDQASFLNKVAAVCTSLTSHELLYYILQIEKDLGRVRDIRWGPRTLDLDLLLYGEEEQDTADLILPHPRMTERAFVLIPLVEVMNLIDAQRAAFYQNILNTCHGKEGVMLWIRT
ncbi:2-amino-4-hydroxy-6-hydroxymethyldihydropteridine diphosphokinase [Paenibacillus albiflavus]|uniref:2-amino-4-hydroxy-6-hydroxymethyldihydropteridine diphosphokinase n=1 Tax=Paenibacillus albiflavus TaxID=2545760 RepID=A0A4R4E5P7_9BACL|nr:2-amino-4-hydroxy-6-hydroxymethyldihydropteridine diphosphokinase [Paenibacillus albiflavus]TCZ74347.1 2-amino-4-hydroxy-6-hydroxymethyldihydropteridine diphosphokinase [Paenibacillus albiflavus]